MRGDERWLSFFEITSKLNAHLAVNEEVDKDYVQALVYELEAWRVEYLEV